MREKGRVTAPQRKKEAKAESSQHPHRGKRPREGRMDKCVDGTNRQMLEQPGSHDVCGDFGEDPSLLGRLSLPVFAQLFAVAGAQRCVACNIPRCPIAQRRDGTDL